MTFVGKWIPRNVDKPIGDQMSEPKRYELQNVELFPGCVAERVELTIYPPVEIEKRYVSLRASGKPQYTTVPVVRQDPEMDNFIYEGKQGQPNAALSAVRESMRYFECPVGHRWLEPYAQAGTYAQKRRCIARDCGEVVLKRRIVSASYSVD